MTTEAPTRTGELVAADIARLAEVLRAAGFRISVQQCVHATRVLVELQAMGRAPADADALAGYFGPIFCASREQQERFPGLVRQWLNRLRPGTGGVAAGPPRKRRSWWRGAIRTEDARWPMSLGAVLLVAGLSALGGWFYLGPRSVEGRVESAAEAVGGAVVSFVGTRTRSESDGHFRIHVRRLDWGERVRIDADGFRSAERVVNGFEPFRVELEPASGSASHGARSNVVITPDPGGSAMVIRPVGFGNESADQVGVLAAPRRLRVWVVGVPVLPWLVLAGWWVGWRRRDQAVFDRRLSPRPPDLRELPLPPGVRHALPSLPIRPLARDLRRLRLVHSRQLDIARTLQATLRRAGWYTPVFGSRVESEYLVLIDRLSPRDHQARLADELVRVLGDAGVGFERLYFDGDPTLCRRPPIPGRMALAPTVTLAELAVRFAEHRLLVFSDGQVFFDPFTGQPAGWLSTLGKWPEKCVMTPNPVAHWGRTEWAIERLGFAVLPVNAWGLRLLGEHFRDRQFSVLSAPGLAAAELPVHEVGRTRWTERVAPTEARVRRLCDELERDLGAEGFRWLTACAVYPELHWSLTLQLGIRLVPDPAARDALLARLVRLIWFRGASMPDWLRRALLMRLPVAERRRMGGWVTEILNEGTRPRGPGRPTVEAESARVAIPTPDPVPAGASWRERWRAVKARRRAGRDFERKLAGLPPDSPLRDYVFLRFLSGRRVDVLTPTVPERIRQWLFPEGNARLGPRGVVVAGLVAMGVSGLLAWWAGSEAWEMPGACVALDVAGTNNTLVACYEDGTATVRSGLSAAVSVADPGGSARVLRSGDPIRAVALSRDATTLILGLQNGRVLVGAAQAELPGLTAALGRETNTASVTSVAFWTLGTNSYVVAGAGDGTVAWDTVAVGGERFTLLAPANRFRILDLAGSPVRGLAFWRNSFAGGLASESGIAGVVESATVRSDGMGWDRFTSAELERQGKLAVVSRGSGVWCVAASPDDRYLAFGRMDGAIVVVGSRGGAAAYAQVGPDPKGAAGRGYRALYRLEGHSAAVLSVRFGPAGHRLVSTGRDGQILVWEVGREGDRNPFQRVTRVAKAVGEGGYYGAAVFTADGRHVLAAASDGRIEVWRVPEPGRLASGSEAADAGSERDIPAAAKQAVRPPSEPVGATKK